MNIDVAQEYNQVPALAPRYEQRSPLYSKPDFMGQLIAPLLHGRESLSNIPQQRLRENLNPIILALQKLDAELLLGLTRTTGQGPRVQTG